VDELWIACPQDKDIGILAKLTKNIKCRGFCGYNSKFVDIVSKSQNPLPAEPLIAHAPRAKSGVGKVGSSVVV